MWDMADNTDDATKDPDILQHLLEAHRYKIQWQEKIRNEDLWEQAGQEPVAKQILWRKWGWIGHTLRKPASSTTRQTLTWNPQEKRRKRGRPCNRWRRDTEAELKQQGTNWSGMTKAAENRVRWRGVVDDLCSTGSDGHMLVSKVVDSQCTLFLFISIFHMHEHDCQIKEI